MNKFLLLSLLFISFELLANSTVVYLREPVRFELPNAQKNKIIKGSFLEQGTRIHVGDKGLVVLKGGDGSVVKLEEGASMEITKLSMSSKENETLYTLVKGSGFFEFPKNKKRKAGVRTKTAALGIRGTRFFVAHGKEEGKGQDVWMCVDEGLVAVATSSTKTPVIVKAGEGVKLAQGLDVSAPKALPWTKKLNWKLDPTLGDLDNTVSIEEAYASPLKMDID